VSLELSRDDPWVGRGYGQAPIEPGERSAVLVVDLQYAFTDPALPMGGAPLVEGAVEGTARVVEAARHAGVPLFETVVGRRDDGADIGLSPIKLPRLREVTLDSRRAQVDERVWGESDILLAKKWQRSTARPPTASPRRQRRAGTQRRLRRPAVPDGAGNGQGGTATSPTSATSTAGTRR
jgi:hypothetical protein